MNVGDYLVVRGKNYKIIDIHPDDAFCAVEGARNMIYVNRGFENNVNKQAFRFRKMIYIRGKFLSVPVSKLHVFRGTSIRFRENKNENNHGFMDLIFSCAVFNASGFYTRSLAITETDMQ